MPAERGCVHRIPPRNKGKLEAGCERLLDIYIPRTPHSNTDLYSWKPPSPNNRFTRRSFNGNQLQQLRLTDCDIHVLRLAGKYCCTAVDITVPLLALLHTLRCTLTLL